MIDNKRLLAIIPARGGSKRLPRKNILYLSGKPVISWTIQAALKSKYIDRTIVSTNDIETANISKDYGADVPFLRPDSLATGTATSVDTILHSINAINDNYDYILILQPTSPLRTYEHIDAAVELFLDKKADSIISVCEAEHPTKWINSLPSDLSMINFIHHTEQSKRSQDFIKEYIINGAIYLIRVDTFVKTMTFFPENSYAYIMDRESSIDIDTEYDLKLCEFNINNYRVQMNNE
jgi:CMP-N-acetylneuraminic acid synthetase